MPISPTVLQAGFFDSYKKKLRFKDGKSPDAGRSLLHCPELTYSPSSSNPPETKQRWHKASGNHTVLYTIKKKKKKALHPQPTNAKSLPVPNLHGMLFYREKTIFNTQAQAQQEDLHKANLKTVLSFLILSRLSL